MISVKKKFQSYETGLTKQEAISTGERRRIILKRLEGFVLRNLLSLLFYLTDIFLDCSWAISFYYSNSVTDMGIF